MNAQSLCVKFSIYDKKFDYLAQLFEFLKNLRPKSQ